MMGARVMRAATTCLVGLGLNAAAASAEERPAPPSAAVEARPPELAAETSTEGDRAPAREVAPSAAAPTAALTPAAAPSPVVAVAAGGDCGGHPRRDLPRRLRYREGVPAPDCYRLVRRQRLGFLLTGGVFFVGGWGSAALIAARDPNYRLAAIPLVGPFMEMAVSGRSSPDMMAWGQWQVAGTILTGLGLAFRYRVWLRDDLKPPRERFLGIRLPGALPARERSVSVSSWRAPGLVGLRFGGSF